MPEIAAALAVHGLRLRGGFRPVPHDKIPELRGGEPAAVVWMVGGVGSSWWPGFKASAFFEDGLPHPLDRWSRAIGQELALRWDGHALFPFDGPPYHPFQQWASRAEALHSSPLMLRLHPQYGLWHAYRFALALPFLSPADATDVPHNAPAAGLNMCLNCEGQPCLNACPVEAFDGATFKLDRCSTHLHTPQGQTCVQAGCAARLACPVGQSHVYLQEHAAFHMRAFVDSH